MRVAAGQHLVRLTAITPANFGDTGGSASVDRPVAVDSWRGLPYLPASALKGVVAGRLGNVELAGGAINPRRAALYGAPGVDGTGTLQATQVVFGDGEPLAFPLLLRDGRRARVVPAGSIHRLVRSGLVSSLDELQRVASEDGVEGSVAAADLPAIAEPVRKVRFGVPPRVLTALLGGSGVDDVILAAPRAAEALWRMAVEERALTALGDDRRVVAGSLRRVETVPPGTTFLVWLTVMSEQGAVLDVEAPLQVGAWEAMGCGYLRAELVDLPEAGERSAEEPTPSAPDTAPEGELPEPVHEVMRRAYQATRELAERKEAAMARTVIYELGPRIRQRGLPRALAFCLARAKVADDASGQESQRSAAYRWLLSQLFDPLYGAPQEDLADRVIAAIVGSAQLPADFEARRLWLRRYAETLLPQESADA